MFFECILVFPPVFLMVFLWKSVFPHVFMKICLYGFGQLFAESIFSDVPLEVFRKRGQNRESE